MVPRDGVQEGIAIFTQRAACRPSIAVPPATHKGRSISSMVQPKTEKHFSVRCPGATMRNVRKDAETRLRSTELRRRQAFARSGYPRWSARVLRAVAGRTRRWSVGGGDRRRVGGCGTRKPGGFSRRWRQQRRGKWAAECTTGRHAAVIDGLLPSPTILPGHAKRVAEGIET